MVNDSMMRLTLRQQELACNVLDMNNDDKKKNYMNDEDLTNAAFNEKDMNQNRFEK